MDERSDSLTSIEQTKLYQAFRAEREEILRHKWLESEKAGHDIGFEAALVDWIMKHRSGWRKAYLRSLESRQTRVHG